MKLPTPREVAIHEVPKAIRDLAQVNARREAKAHGDAHKWNNPRVRWKIDVWAFFGRSTKECARMVGIDPVNFRYFLFGRSSWTANQWEERARLLNVSPMLGTRLNMAASEEYERWKDIPFPWPLSTVPTDLRGYFIPLMHDWKVAKQGLGFETPLPTFSEGTEGWTKPTRTPRPLAEYPCTCGAGEDHLAHDHKCRRYNVVYRRMRDGVDIHTGYPPRKGQETE